MRRTLALVVGAVLLVACSDDTTSSSGSVGAAVSTDVTADAGAVGVEEIPDDSVIGRYVAALDAGDTAMANALRCQSGRVPDENMELFAAEVAALKAALGGSIAIDQATIVDPITLGTLDGNRPDTQVAFSLITPDGPTSLVAVAVATENGSQVLCGEMQEGSPGVQSQVAAASIVPNEATVADLTDLLPSEIVPGATQVDDREMTDLAQVPGAVAGWTRAWSVPGGGVRVTLFRTDSPDAAVTLASQALTTPGLDSAEHLADLPSGFQGVSAVSSPWTWVHPASVGGRVDTAAGVVGDVAVVVEATGVRAGDDHGVISQALVNLGLS